MKTVICLCGISGVGKTWERTHNPELMKLPYVDIADEYQSTSDYEVAWSQLIQHVQKALKKSNKVVVEAIFTWRQQNKMKYQAEQEGWEVVFQPIPKPDKEVLLNRIKNDYDCSSKTSSDLKRMEARVQIVQNLY